MSLPALKNIATAIAVATFFSTFATMTLSQQIGDRVVVTANFETKIFKDRVDQVYEGSIHSIVAIKDKWCSLSDVKGWLPLQNVMNLRSAKRLYDKRIQDNPRDSFAYAHRGMIQLEANQYDQALADLNMSYQLNPQNMLTLNNIGKVLNAMGRYEEAAKLIEDVLQKYPKFPLALYNLGLTYYAMNRNEESIKNFDKAIELQTTNPWFYLSRGSAKLNIGDDKGAMEDYDAAIKLDGQMADAFVGKSNVYLSRDDYENALKFAESAVRAQPKNAMALNARGWIHYRTEKFDEAISDFNEAIRNAPKLPVSYNNRGVVYAALKIFDSAIKDYNQSILLSQTAPVAYANRGTAWIGLGDFAKAKSDLEKAIAIAPNLSEASNAYAWFLATCPNEKFRNGKLAVENATKVCEATQWKSWSYLDTLAAAYAESGDFDSAVKWCEKTIELAPEADQAGCKERLALYQAKKPFRSTSGKTSGRSRANRG